MVCADISGKMLAATRKRLGDDGVRYVKLGDGFCILNHMNVLSERGWARFLRELDKNLMGRHGTAFSVMTDGIMQRFLDHLGYEVIEKDTTSIPRDCVWVVRAPADNG